MITHDRHHHDLTNCGECPFSNDGYVTPSTHGSDKLHITKTSPHRQWLVNGMPSNQLPQATFGFPHSCQLGRAVPCYVFFLFSTMELSSPLCLVTDAYAPYAPYAPYSPYAPFYAPSMYYVCIPHGHFSYLRVCNIFGPFLSFKDFILFYKDLACEIDLNFCWLMFFGELKLRFELEKLSNKFILNLAKFQVDFTLEDFNSYFSNDFKMNLNFKSIKFPAPHPSELPFIKFPAKSRINTLFQL